MGNLIAYAYLKNIYNSTTLLSSEKEKAFLNLYSSSVDMLTYKLLIAKWLKGDPDPDTSSIPKTTIFDDEMINISYPVLKYPTKIVSLNFDKTPIISGVLDGIKGQYLLLDCGVLNLRKFSSYHLGLSS